MYKNIFVLVVVAISLLFLFNISGNKKPIIITNIDTLYKYDTFRITKKGIPYKVFIPKDSIIRDTIKDTINIVIDYSHFKAYSDTIKIDSSTFIIDDTISKNSLLSRSFRAIISERIITKTIVKPQKDAIYIGGVSNFKYAGVGILYQKQNQIIGLSFNTDKSINLSYYVKIRL
jgi:hypothetical protein